jgi:MoaA/NifB/PqqE/SkfB family radical SAM enzyme
MLMTDTVTMKSVEADARFERQFSGRLMQIFLYVTDECNIRCQQCYYSPWLKKGPAEMPTSTVLALLRKFRELGAIKLTLLGGEPTLYGRAEGNKRIPYLVHAAHQLGYEYVRMVTNGLFKTSLLDESNMKEIDEITFSIDSDVEETHDLLRGRNTFNRTVKNLLAAIGAGYRTHVTMCVHRHNIGRAEDGTLLLARAIKWAASLGVKSFNIHPLFRMGVPRDTWTGNTDIQPSEWLPVYREITSLIKDGAFKTAVRMPLRFASNDEFEEKPRFYGYCSVKHSDRLDVHLNGQIHTCALHNGTPVSIAHFADGADGVSITWASSDNEIEAHSYKEEEQHCPVMTMFPPGLRPLCISLKPGQDELIWNRLHFD